MLPALLAALVAGAPAASAAGAPSVLAVLEFKVKLKGADRDAVDAGYFSNVVRSAALAAAPQLRIMTRENMLVLLQASGKKLEDCEGECEVETGRRLGAELVVSGDLLRIGKLFKLDLRMHDTREARLVAGAQASGESIEALDAAVAPAVKRLFEPLSAAAKAAALGASPPAPVPPPQPAGFLGRGRVVDGTWAEQDGRLTGTDGSYAPDGEFTEGVIEVDAERVSGDLAVQWAVGWRMRKLEKGGAGVWAAFTFRGAYQIMSGEDPTGWYVLTSGWGPNKGYKPTPLVADRKVHVRVEVVGDAYTVEVDGKPLDKGSDSRFRLGQVFLNVGKGLSVRFSNLVVTRR
jgi:hypothetical protein